MTHWEYRGSFSKGDKVRLLKDITGRASTMKFKDIFSDKDLNSLYTYQTISTDEILTVESSSSEHDHLVDTPHMFSLKLANGDIVYRVPEYLLWKVE